MVPPDDDLYRGLRALVASAFPKQCRNCGRSFADVGQFLRETVAMEGHSGLKELVGEEEGETVVALFRNCPCGSTLMGEFGERRDRSAAGRAFRRRFEELVVLLARRGISHAGARTELLKLLRGEPSAVAQWLNDPDSERSL